MEFDWNNLFEWGGGAQSLDGGAEPLPGYATTCSSQELFAIRLLVAGGDVDEIITIHNALSMLNQIDI
jgi:hypothetical protein